ncbi:MAG: 4'-phosphopantetheinyl transferase family protein [Acidimicrobiales bacterium]
MSAVDVWMFPVLPGAAEDPALREVVGPDDAERVDRLGPASDRDRAVCARVAARTVLGRRLAVPADAVPLQLGDGGPTVDDRDTSVSWSHSGEWIALAIGHRRPVGIDIEEVPARLDLGALAELGVGSLEEFVGLEAASKATECVYGGAWPPDVAVRRLSAPDRYVAAVAAPGDDWTVEVHMRSPLENLGGSGAKPLSRKAPSVTLPMTPFPGREYFHVWT